MINNKSKQGRFYYPVGLISLVLLPILCILYLNKNGAFDRFGGFDIMFWSPKLHLDNPNIFSKESHPDLIYADVFFDESEIFNEQKFKVSQLLVNKLINSNDSLTGVHFHFSNNSKYETFIKILEILKNEKANLYIPFENDIWVFNQKLENTKGIESVIVPCGGNYNAPSFHYVEDQIQKNQNFKYFFEIIKIYSFSILLFLIMIFLAIKKIIR